MSRATCATCGRIFGSVTGFDRHRRKGRCVDPSTLGMRTDDRGMWHFAPPDAAARQRLREARGIPEAPTGPVRSHSAKDEPRNGHPGRRPAPPQP